MHAPGTLNTALAVALGPLASDPAAGPRARSRIEWAAAAGFCAVAIDAADPETRPRDLDRSARRDLASLLRRLELGFAGADLWIPPAHFLSNQRQGRAIDAVQSALTFAAELAALAGGAPLVHIALPPDMPAEVVSALTAAAESAGAVLADFHWPPPTANQRHEPMALGIDPAEALAAGADPVEATITRASEIRAARLSDYTRGARVIPGDGRLDLPAFAATVAATRTIGPLIVDVQGLARPCAAAHRVVSTWRRE